MEDPVEEVELIEDAANLEPIDEPANVEPVEVRANVEPIEVSANVEPIEVAVNGQERAENGAGGEGEGGNGNDGDEDIVLDNDEEQQAPQVIPDDIDGDVVNVENNGNAPIAVDNVENHRQAPPAQDDDVEVVAVVLGGDTLHQPSRHKQAREIAELQRRQTVLEKKVDAQAATIGTLIQFLLNRAPQPQLPPPPLFIPAPLVPVDASMAQGMMAPISTQPPLKFVPYSACADIASLPIRLPNREEYFPTEEDGEDKEEGEEGPSKAAEEDKEEGEEGPSKAEEEKKEEIEKKEEDGTGEKDADEDEPVEKKRKEE
ncbi:hypothetical protein GCK72_025179 [Caenorhabditis remanei]|uniref:Uncharacterized protein n=1 Tax=Caenorhabditis remanei TaxID=31234 RepID=A0A6A5G216_CAERE|nr:hypothetical protein GCK72_025179 [Caenorhabditis remanei]KAF1748712.1 hypothetical protein GCK72_025179 [Caenorhabditis remanei]